MIHKLEDNKKVFLTHRIYCLRYGLQNALAGDNSHTCLAQFHY